MAGGRIEIDVEPELSGFDRKLASGLKGSAGIAGTIGKGIGVAFAAGVVGAGVALTAIVKLGVQYTDNLNSLQAVTQATGLQMRKVSETATKLGSDLTLPATSAADAAAAMLELAKGGLTVEQAMTAAKGTLQLAAAAQITGAQAAEIQSNSLQAFGLSAESAGHVSDVLANSANAASGEITDFAQAMAQVGAVAHQLNISLDDTATVLALLANAGIKGCYDDQTDVLTLDGYKPWADVSLADHFATLNPTTGQIEYQRASRLVRYRHTGKMYEVRNKHVDLCVTPEHRMWVRPRGRSGFEVRTAEEVAGRTVEYTVTGEWTGREPGTVQLPGFAQNRASWTKQVEPVDIPARAWAAFLGYYLSEGSCDHGRHGYRVSIAQQPGAKRDKMLADLSELPFTITAGKRALVISSEQLYRAVHGLGHSADKHVPAEVKGWSRPLLKVFYEAFRLGDGDDQGNLYTCSTRMRDDLEEIVTKCGWGARHGLKQATGSSSTMRDGRVVTASRDQWIVWVNFRHLTPAFDQSAYHSPVHAARLSGVGTKIREGWVDYDGEVFCATVPNHLLIVRRGGKTIVSGNSDAGTLLKSALLALSSPSKPAAAAMKELSLTAFDAAGKFVGLESIMAQLHTASGKLTTQQYAQASSTLFGSDAARLAGVAAGVTAEQWDKMGVAISRTGGAAEVAAAKTKGLGGAIEGFKSQVETAGLLIFDAIDGPIEAMVRSASEGVARLAPVIAGGVETAVAGAALAGAQFGPSVARAIRDRADAIRGAVSGVLSPLVDGATELANSGLNIAIGLFEELTKVLRGAVTVVTPISEGIGDLAESANDAGGPLGVVSTSIGLLGDTAGVALVILRPIAEIVGGLVGAFGDLPGPVQSAVVAMLALKLVRGPVDDLAGSVSGRLTGAFRGFREEMRLQQSLLTGSTSIISSQVGQLGLAAAALESRSPALRAMGDSFRSAAAGAERFGTAQGLAAAAGSGIKLAGTSLVSFLGGPWGLAIGAATVGLGLLASHHQKSAEATRKSEASQKDFAKALIASGGAVNQAIRDQVFDKLNDPTVKAIDNAKTLGIAYAHVTDAVLDQGDAYEKLTTQLKAVVAAETNLETDPMSGITVESLTAKGQAASKLLESINNLNGEFTDGAQDAKDYAAAQGQTGTSMLESTDTGRSLAEAMGVLSDKTASADDRARALKDALDAFSGGNIAHEQALARLNGQIARLGPGFLEAASAAKGAGVSIVDASGAITTTTDAGRRLLEMTDDVSVSMTEAATATFEFARANGDDIPTAAGKAFDAATKAKQAFVDAGVAAGLSAAQVEALTIRYGLLPDVAATSIETPGSDKALLELSLVAQKVHAVPNGKTITVASLSDEAKQKLIDLGFTVRNIPGGRVEVTANTQPARDGLNAFLREPAFKTVQITYALPRGGIPAGPGRLGLAHGAMVSAYAAGGVHKLTPMKAGLARIVPPNTWRVVGDRIKDDELYLPLNRSVQRNHDLLQLAARRMGYAAVRMYADGGIAQRTTPTGMPASFGDTNVFVTIDGQQFEARIDRVVRENNRALKRRVGQR